MAFELQASKDMAFELQASKHSHVCGGKYREASFVDHAALYVTYRGLIWHPNHT